MKNYLLIFFLFFIFNKAHSIETKIIHNIQNEIITNIDIKNEFKYLVSLNSNLKKLNKEKILSISNESVIRERIKKIEILKNYKEVKITEEYSLNLINNIFSRLNLKSIDEFKIYLKNYDLTLEDVKRRITIDDRSRNRHPHQRWRDEYVYHTPRRERTASCSDFLDGCTGQA